MTDEMTIPSGAGLQLFGDGQSPLPKLRDDMSLDQRKEAVRDASKKIVFVDDKLQIAQGELLWEIKENNYWKTWEYAEDHPFKTFDDYVDRELAMGRRKAYYLVGIYSKLVVDLGLPLEVLRGLEWSRAKELVPVINEDNWQELLKKIEGMSVSAIKDMVKDMRDDPDTPTMVKKVFNFHPDQACTVQAALEAANEISPSESPAVHMDMICVEFLANNLTSGLSGALVKISDVIDMMERAYGVKLEIKEMSEEYAKAFGEEIDEGDSDDDSTEE